MLLYRGSKILVHFFRTSIKTLQLHDNTEASTPLSPLLLLKKFPSNIHQICQLHDGYVSYALELQVCVQGKSLADGKRIHGNIIKNGIEFNRFLETKLVIMYTKCGCPDDARQVFDKMQEPNLVSWTSMIGGYARHGRSVEALRLFYEMQSSSLQPDNFLIPLILKACANLGALQQGKLIHNRVIVNDLESNVFVGSALVDLYAKCRCTDSAQQMFDKMSEKNLVTWNAMIAGYSQNGHGEEALKLFRLMESSGLTPNVTSWNSLISGYAQRGHEYEALVLLREMRATGEKPNFVTMLSVLPACANIGALEKIKEIHGYIIRSGFESHVSVGSAVVDMYCKCGSVIYARQMFDKMLERDVVSWSSMIQGYAMHGHAEDALRLFKQMEEAGAKPDYITFIGVLTACSHAGLIDEGRKYIDRMSWDYGIKPRVEHYSCLVDLLGRAGHLNEAYELINKMPVKPNVAVWGALLNACRIHCNIDLGEVVAERLFVLEPENAGNFVLLSNIYSAAGRWDDVSKVRKRMRDSGVQKIPGSSWIELKNHVHEFVSGDRKAAGYS